MPNPYQNLQWSQAAIQPGVSQVPVEAFKYLAEKKEDTYLKNRDKVDLITASMAQAKVLGKDQGLKQGIIDNVKGVIQTIADRGGDYENASREITSLGRDIMGNEDLLFAQERYAENAALKKQADEDRRAKRLDKAGYERRMKSLNNDYQGAIKNEDGTYILPEYDVPVSNRDLHDQIRKRLSSVKATFNRPDWQYDDKFKGMMSKRTTAEIKIGAVNDAIDQVLNDGENKAFLQQLADSEGVPVEQLIEEYKSSYASSAGVVKADEQIRSIAGLDPITGQRILSEEEKEEFLPPAQTFEDKGITTEQKAINPWAVYDTSAKVNNALDTDIPAAQDKTKEAIADSKANLEKLGKELEAIDNINSPEYIQVQTLIEDEKVTAKVQTKKLNKLKIEQAQLENIRKVALEKAGVSSMEELGSQTDIQEAKRSAELTIKGNTPVNMDFDRNSPNLAINKLFGTELPTHSTFSPVTVGGKTYDYNEWAALDTNTKEALTAQYGEENYSKFMKGEQYATYNKAIEELTADFTASRYQMSFPSAGAAEAFSKNFATDFNLPQGGKSKGLPTITLDDERVPINLKYYDNDKDRALNRSEDYAGYKSIAWTGFTVRDGLPALVGVLNRTVGGKDYMEQVTFSDRSYIDNLLSKPEFDNVKPMVATMIAADKALNNIGSPQDISMSQLDIHGLYLPIHTSSAEGGINTELTLIKPSIVANRNINESNSIEYSISFEAYQTEEKNGTFVPSTVSRDITEKMTEQYSNYFMPAKEGRSQKPIFLNLEDAIEFIDAFRMGGGYSMQQLGLAVVEAQRSGLTTLEYLGRLELENRQQTQ